MAPAIITMNINAESGKTSVPARRRAGFTLGESMVVLLLLTLVAGAMTAGVLFGFRQYTASMAASESRVLSSTLMNVISNELSNGRNFRLTPEGTLLSFYSQNYGDRDQAAGFSVDEEGRLLLNDLPVVSNGSYPRGISVELRPIVYSAGRFHVELVLVDGGGNELFSNSFDVLPLNPGEILADGS